MSAPITLSFSHRLVLVSALVAMKQYLTPQVVGNAVNVLRSRHRDIPDIPQRVVNELVASYQDKTDALLKRVSAVPPTDLFECTPGDAPFVTTSLTMMAYLNNVPVPVAMAGGPIDRARIDGLFHALRPGLA